jgi:hypothetical protein
VVSILNAETSVRNKMDDESDDGGKSRIEDEEKDYIKRGVT